MIEIATETKRERPINIENMTLTEIQERNLAHLMIKNRTKRVYIKKDHRFKVGNNLAGRRSSSQDKTWYSISYWHKKLEREWSLLKPNQRAHYSVELIKLLASKLNTLPVDMKDSISNASETLSLIKSLESISNTKTITATTESTAVTATSLSGTALSGTATSSAETISISKEICLCEIDKNHIRNDCQRLRKEMGLTSIGTV